MDRLLEAVELALFNETTVAWIDSLMLCLGLTLTLAAAAPALRALRRGRGHGKMTGRRLRSDTVAAR